MQGNGTILFLFWNNESCDTLKMEHENLRLPNSSLGPLKGGTFRRDISDLAVA